MIYKQYAKYTYRDIYIWSEHLEYSPTFGQNASNKYPKKPFGLTAMSSFGASKQPSQVHYHHLGVEPKIGKHPKMDGENNGKPY